MKRRMIIMLMACLLVFGGVFGLKYMGNKGMQTFFDNKPVKPATISAIEVGKAVWPQQVEGVGSLIAVNGIEVTTETAGTVEAIHFESGQQVEAGTVLVTLDAETDRADLQTYQAQARLAQSEVKRQRQLFKLQSTSQADLDRAESEAAQAAARVQSQQARLQQKEIRAAFAGELGIRKVDLGQYITPGTAIVSLQTLDPLYADFHLPEQHLMQVRASQPAVVRVDLYPQQRFEGQVEAVESRVDPATRNFRVRVKLPNSEGLLRPGLFARVAVNVSGESEVLVVPRTAISYNAYGNSVFVLQSEETTTGERQLLARQRFVQTGPARGDFVSIVKGLEAGEQVATSGLLKLRNNQPVVINNDLQPKVSQNPSPADS